LMKMEIYFYNYFFRTGRKFYSPCFYMFFAIVILQFMSYNKIDIS